MANSSANGGPGARRSSIPVLAIEVLVLLAGVAAAVEVPAPEPGLRADVTLALLRHNRSLCDGLANRILTYWRDLPPDRGPQLEGNERTVRRHVTRHLLADLASARAASDLIRRFLPATLGEVSVETGASIARLFELQGTLCDAVALPSGPRHHFADEIAEALARIDAEEGELGRLLVVPDEDLAEALAPYRDAIELAGVEAEGELLTYLESLKPEPVGPTLEDRMRAWHGGYAAAVRPSKEALGRFLAARQRGDRQAVGSSCRELSRVTVALLSEHAALFRSPEPGVGPALLNAFRSLRSMSVACTAGDFARVDQKLARAEKLLGDAASRLRPFGLAP